MRGGAVRGRVSPAKLVGSPLSVKLRRIVEPPSTCGAAPLGAAASAAVAGCGKSALKSTRPELADAFELLIPDDARGARLARALFAGATQSTARLLFDAFISAAAPMFAAASVFVKMWFMAVLVGSDVLVPGAEYDGVRRTDGRDEGLRGRALIDASVSWRYRGLGNLDDPGYSYVTSSSSRSLEDAGDCGGIGASGSHSFFFDCENEWRRAPAPARANCVLSISKSGDAFSCCIVRIESV